VDRFGDRFEAAPKSIQRFYHINQALLPIYLTPNHDTQHMLAARVGGTVKRPYEYKKGLEKLYSDNKKKVQSWLPQKNQTVGESNAQVEQPSIGDDAGPEFGPELEFPFEAVGPVNPTDSNLDLDSESVSKLGAQPDAQFPE